MLSSTGVKPSTSASGSQPSGNTKKDKIQQTPSSTQNDHVAKILGYGDYHIGNVTISRVYYVEGLGHNLFSVGQICYSNLEVTFRQHTCFIRNLEGVDLLTGFRSNNLYTLSLGDMMASSPICLLSKASKTKSWLWHRRLSYLNLGAINHLARHGLVRGLLKLKFEKDHLSKDEAPDFIIKFLKMIQVRLKVPVRRIRTDNGTEFVNQTLREYYEKVGISHETSVARSPQQNGVVERRNHTLIEAARTMLIYAKAPMDNPNLTMEEYIRIEEEKAHKHGKVFSWQTATYGKIRVDDDLHGLSSVETEFPAIVINNAFAPQDALQCKSQVSIPVNDEIDFRISFDESDDEDYTIICDKNSYVDDLDFFKKFENEFPAIVYNDAQTSKSDLLTKPTLTPQHIDEFNLKDKTSLSECDEEEQNVLNFNDLFPFNVIYPNDSKSDKDNDDDKVDVIQNRIEHSSRDLSVKPLPDVINTDVGAYAHGSNKLLEISHDTSNKFFKTETFIDGLNFNIMTWNHLNKGMSFIFLIKNLYVPIGIPFDPKLFYKDGIKLGQTDYTAYPNPMDTAYRLSGRYPVFIFSIVNTAYSLNEYSVFDTGINTAYPGDLLNENDEFGGVHIFWNLMCDCSPDAFPAHNLAHKCNLENLSSKYQGSFSF
ncbi:integrase, catalytic region, zinc finger, CCHC-type containing protein [Tanacetum coccineum]